MQPDQPQGFADPTPAGQIRPRILDCNGRLVIIVPTLLEIVPNSLSVPPGQPQKRITADMFVLDGGPLIYGGRPEAEEPKPHTLQIATPARFTGVYISQAGLVGALADSVGKAVVLGRIHKGKPAPGRLKGPWQLLKLDQNDPGRQAAQQFYAAFLAGNWTPPTPQPIPGAPAPSMANSGTYATTMPHTAAGVPIPQGGVQLPPGSPAWQPPAVPAPAPAQLGAAVQEAAQAQPAPAIPAGFEAVWHTIAPEMQAQILAAQAAPAQAPAAPNPF